MIIDVTDFNPKHFEKVIQWLWDVVDGEVVEGDGTVLLAADSWRIFKKENSIEGYYETTWFLEFDRDSDGTAFLLRWA